MNVKLSDEEMIRHYLPHKPDQCFETLYNRYVGKVYRRCLSMTKDSEQAHDFTHDIFLKVFDKLTAFQERSSFSTWLYSIAYNYCSDQLRIAKRLNFSSIEEGVKHEPVDSHDAQLHEETIQLVKRAMETLSSKEQDLLRLKYEDGLSIDTIAQTYDLNTSTVKMRLKRSRDKIHQLCAQQYGS